MKIYNMNQFNKYTILLKILESSIIIPHMFQIEKNNDSILLQNQFVKIIIKCNYDNFTRTFPSFILLLSGDNKMFVKCSLFQTNKTILENYFKFVIHVSIYSHQRTLPDLQTLCLYQLPTRDVYYYNQLV